MVMPLTVCGGLNNGPKMATFPCPEPINVSSGTGASAEVIMVRMCKWTITGDDLGEPFLNASASTRIRGRQREM